MTLPPKWFVAQRLSALLLAPLVIAHLLGIIYAAQGGLDAAEILARTRGNFLFAAFYQLFVITAALHAAIGLRVVCAEWGGMRGRALNWLTAASALGLFALGSYAVLAVTLG
ncbi:MAG: succinate dehydrogenase [Gammaproteobacteria bacterium]